MFHHLKKIFSKGKKDVHFNYEEKKYPMGVIVLVFAMTFLLIMLGERALSDMSDGIPSIDYPAYEDIPAVQELRTFERDVYWPLQSKRGELERNLLQTRGEYDTRLLEKVARVPEPFYGTREEIQKDFSTLSAELASVTAELERIELRHEELQDKAENARKPVMREYRWKVGWRQLHLFVWELLFLVPFFAFSLFLYTRQRQHESRWELISLSMLITASLLSLQSICTVIWSWIPREFLQWLWELLSLSFFTRIIGYYLMMAIAILLFGGLIVFIHQRLTDPVRGGKHRIRRGLCPSCSYPLNLSEMYCGGCGKELRKKCSSCGSSNGFTWQARCVQCGK
jgi:hypothetical protein